MNDPLSLVQSAYDCFGRGDIPGLLQKLSTDIDWTFRADKGVAYNGRFSGHGQVLEWFQCVAQNDAIQAFEPREFLVGPDHVTVLGWERTAAQPGGRIYECEWVHVWRVRDGKVSRFWGTFDTQAAAGARS